jgi:CBS domain-containing protein
VPVLALLALCVPARPGAADAARHHGDPLRGGRAGHRTSADPRTRRAGLRNRRLIQINALAPLRRFPLWGDESGWLPQSSGPRCQMEDAMITIRQLLEQKGCDVCFIHPDATVFDAIAKMADNDVGSLVVVERDALVGIITERHYARNVVLKGKTSPMTPVREIMEKDVVTVGPEQRVGECMAIMTEKRVRHLPVVEGGKLIGIVSIGDLVKSIIGNQRFVIDQLEHYIYG